MEEQEESNNHHHNANIQEEFQSTMSLLFPIKRPTNSTTTHHRQEEWIQSIRTCLQAERDAIRTKHQMAFLPTRPTE